MRAALRGGFFVGGESYFQAQRFNEKEFIQKLMYNGNKSKQELMYELYTSLHGRALSSMKILRRTAREYVYRCRRSKCAYFGRVDASPAEYPPPKQNFPAKSVTLRFTLLTTAFILRFSRPFPSLFSPARFLSFYRNTENARPFGRACA